MERVLSGMLLQTHENHSKNIYFHLFNTIVFQNTYFKNTRIASGITEYSDIASEEYPFSFACTVQTNDLALIIKKKKKIAWQQAWERRTLHENN